MNSRQKGARGERELAQPDAGAGSAPDEPPSADLITADDIQKFREDQERRRLERIAEKITKGATA